MAFGQQSGPPASARQMRDLLDLLHQAGHSDFRDARGPMGFTQRQAAGKFTRDEAEAFIEGLENAADDEVSRAEDETPDPEIRLAPVVPLVAPSPRDPVPPSLRRVPAPDLADELRRRGWTVTGPPSSPRSPRTR
jgi:hypothetical protein